MEPLKEMFNKAYFQELAAQLQTVYPSFDKVGFVKSSLHKLDELELNARLRRTTEMLHQYLPGSFHKNVELMKELAPKMKTGYTGLVYPDYVAHYGTSHFKDSLNALKYFTLFGSSEFAIRHFLKLNFDTTIKEMIRWADDENVHVRRLASEGSRPRLPWSFKLDLVIEHPEKTQLILEKLKTDSELYVKKSVANHLNDFSKDNPDYMLSLVKRWDMNNADTRWIVKHACRNLIKQGNATALSIFNFSKDAKVTLFDLKVKAKKINLGETLAFSFILKSDKSVAQQLVIDYKIYYCKKGEKPGSKVFKLKELTLAPYETVEINKSQLIKDFSTRKHYPGKHNVELLVNGKVMDSFYFNLTT